MRYTQGYHELHNEFQFTLGCTYRYMYVCMCIHEEIERGRGGEKRGNEKSGEKGRGEKRGDSGQHQRQ